MLKIRTILFLVLAVTVGGVYAAWSYPVATTNYATEFEVAIEVEDAVSTGIIASTQVHTYDSRVIISKSEANNFPTISLYGELDLEINLVEGANVEDKTFYLYGSLENVSNVKNKNGDEVICVDSYEIRLSEFSFSGENYTYVTFNLNSLDTGDNIYVNYNVIDPLDTYEQYQEFVDLFDEDAALSIKLYIREE